MTTVFCWCGRVLKQVTKDRMMCEKHGYDTLVDMSKREKIGKYSGASKTPYGGYENR